MKMIIILVMLISCITPVKAIEFQGKSYVVMDSMTQSVIESYNIDHVQSVASISKIMTAIIAIENAKLDDVYTIGEEVNEAWGSGVYIHIGDKITLKDLLYGVLLRSGNDACMTLARNVAGDVDKFVDMMNKKAKEIGMSNTHFSNPTGLDEEDDGNQSSAYDIALLMSYCSQNPIFNEIVSSKEYVREDGNGKWHNKNRLLKEYKYCVGGKTGFTTKAKRTLVTRAIKDGMSLVIVTLNCGNDFDFHKQKYEQCFDMLKNQIVLNRGIYNYKGHSFVIDDDIFYYKKSDVSYFIHDNQIDLFVGYKKIMNVDVIHPFLSVLIYAYILLGDYFG